MPSWKDLPPIAKFSVIAFAIALILGLMSLGAEGFGIYYAVGFGLPVSIDSLRGDAFWPSTILAGMAWSIGFLIAGWICVRIRSYNKYTIWLIYVAILWIWDYIVWWAIITFKVVQ
ncbi:MAG TPA: hypothetical protein VK508_17640 [Cyclobacteriaceae bacterium]|nr:hypothetical protein [Cyclobacteriaceae bacterium]